MSTEPETPRDDSALAPTPPTGDAPATESDPAPGRPVTLEPVPPGWRLLVGGVILAALGPMFGFLVGSMVGRGDGDGLSPLYVWMLVGLLVGGVGVAMALMGGHTIYDRNREEREQREAAGATADPSTLG